MTFSCLRSTPLRPTLRSPLLVRLLAALALLGTVALLGGCGGARPAPASSNHALFQKRLPKFERPTLAGHSITTKPDRTGVVVVKFFAKYCKPCKKTLPAAQALHEDYSDVTFIGIAEDEYRKDVESMVKTYGLTFHIVHDRGNSLAGRFRTDTLPATFVTDKDGAIVWVGGPKQNETDLENAIKYARSLP